VVGIIGRNGAGKTTLLKILSRITEPTEGYAEVRGRVGSLLEVGTGFHPELTGRENIYLNGAILGMRKAEIDKKFDEIVAFAEVERFIDTPVKHYSSGMYVRLAFAVAAHLEPEILLVDEVLAVGDAAFQKKCLGKMEDVAKEGRTVLFVSHQMAAIENLCNRCLLVEGGRLIKDDVPSSVIAHYLKNVLEPAIIDGDLSQQTNRSGTGEVRLTGFHLEDTNGNIVPAARSGSDIVLVFHYRRDMSVPVSKNVDVGFSFHSVTTWLMLSVLYSSYQGITFDLSAEKGEIRCRIHRLPLAPGRYRLGARITVNGVESDWPRDGIGFIDVVEGDFFGTGKSGFGENVPFLIKGDWEVREE
jgi:lipopolysaccharide transport system ATP-binding protein